MADAGKTLSLRPSMELPPELSGGVVAIGNFDGVHLGHQAVLEKALALARSQGSPGLVMTFEPHPRTVFRPETPVFRLTPAPIKEKLIHAMGFDALIVQNFDRAFSQTTANTFVNELLGRRLRVKWTVTGEDFHFGRDREGTPEFLRANAAALGVTVTLVAPVRDGNGEIISSSRIRDALAAGEIALANRLLGRDWLIRGTVIGGKRLGRTLGFPTANIVPPPETRLRHGIYAVRAALPDGTRRDGVASYGRRPTFDNGAVLLEVFLFDFTGDLYGAEIDVTFHGFIRDEAKFSSSDALVRQMELDVEAARSLLDRKGR
jgi:riboflavin kinase / FMN adenylyltransferase